MAKPKLWLGLASVGALLTTMVYAGQRLADDNASLINDALGLNQKRSMSLLKLMMSKVRPIQKKMVHYPTPVGEE